LIRFTRRDLLRKVDARRRETEAPRPLSASDLRGDHRSARSLFWILTQAPHSAERPSLSSRRKEISIMGWFFKTASAASFSLLLLGTANAQPADPAAAVAKKSASFDHLSFTVRQMTLQGASTSFNIDKDGNYTVTTDGGMAHFIMIRAKGQLSSSQMQSLENALAKMKTANPP